MGDTEINKTTVGWKGGHINMQKKLLLNGKGDTEIYKTLVGWQWGHRNIPPKYSY